MKDYYYILGVQQAASVEEIKKAHRKLSHKFHPDKNDGDEFFSDRFKEIQEAYETLSETQSRNDYDEARNEFLFAGTQNAIPEVEPEIEYFKSNRTSFEFGDEIIISWRTLNADKIILRPFGEVQSYGQKKIRIKDVKKSFLFFELIAENSLTNRQIKESIIIEKYLADLKETGTHRDSDSGQAETEKKKNVRKQKVHKKQESEDKEQHKKITTVVIVILLALTIFRVIQQFVK